MMTMNNFLCIVLFQKSLNLCPLSSFELSKTKYNDRHFNLAKQLSLVFVL